MPKYLFASHGKFSEGTRSFLEIMAGKNLPIFTLSAFVDDRSVGSLVSDALAEAGEFDQLFIFCDLHGGSVAQEVFRQTHDLEKNIQVIAGYNLALALDIIARGTVLTADEIREAVEEARTAIVYLNDYSSSHQNTGEEESLF